VENEKLADLVVSGDDRHGPADWFAGSVPSDRSMDFKGLAGSTSAAGAAIATTMPNMEAEIEIA
jgi:hypothetical protein